MTALDQPAGATSPFKFLDAYGAQDASVFFGRDEEIDELYRLLGESRLVLVYGQPGTGKTSLVQSGLAKKFSATNWLPLTVRRGSSIAAPLDQVLGPAAAPTVQRRNIIGAALGEVLSAAAITPLEPDSSKVDEIRSVFLDHLRPVFLIIDQFEELYLFGTKAEQDAFYATIKAVLDADVSCRIILLLREEYLAALDPFERAVPALFDKRLRVEVMTNSNVEMVILRTCSAHGIGLEHGADTARLIVSQLDDKRMGVQLAYLQVYLDYLYRGAAKVGGTITFTDAAIGEAGKFGDVMAGFLNEQEAAIQKALGNRVPPGGIARLLEEFVSAAGTKQPSTYDQVLKRIPSAKPWLQDTIDLLQQSRLLRSVDAHYELAHDALAGSIAERRSDESKQLLLVEKLVQNRLVDFAQFGTLLNSDELAMVRQARLIPDPLDGSSMLKLDSEAIKFEKKSHRRMWRRRIAIGLVVVAVAAIATVLVQQNREEVRRGELQRALEKIDKANASNVDDLVGFSVYHNLQHVADPETRIWSAWAHDTVRYGNIKRDLGRQVESDSFDTKIADRSFWGRLYDADLLFDGKRDAEGIAAYSQLELELRKQYAANRSDVTTIGRLKAVLWHHYFSLATPNPQLAGELFDLLETEMREIKGDPLGFVDDLPALCSQRRAYADLGTRCAKYADPPEAPAALPSNAAPNEDAGPPPRMEYDTTRRRGN